MKNKNKLTVQPIRRYNKPIYPSYQDKNPLEHPDTMPYPFTKKALNALLAAGILVGLPQFMSCDIPSANAANTSYTSQGVLGNPFTFEKMGVPYIPASFGTGLPSRLSESDARGIIEKVFDQEGLDLEKEYIYHKDGVKVKLDGYNAEMKIGYVWVDYSNMGVGMVNRYNYSATSSYYKNPLENIKNRSFEEIKEEMGHQFQFLENDYKEILNQLNEADKIESEKERRDIYNSLYLDALIIVEKKHDRNDAKDFLERNIIKKTVDHKATVLVNLRMKQAIEGHINSRHGSGKENKDLLIIKDHGEKILQIKSPEEKLKQFSILIGFLNVGKNFRYSRKDKKVVDLYNSILKIENKKEFLIEATAFMDKVDGEKLSLKEAEKIESLGKTQKDFIAPISQRDNRFIYNRRGLGKEKREELQKLRSTVSSEEYNKVYSKAYQEAEVISKQKVLNQLENQVRQYIDWAKHQY